MEVRRSCDELGIFLLPRVTKATDHTKYIICPNGHKQSLDNLTLLARTKSATD